VGGKQSENSMTHMSLLDGILESAVNLLKGEKHGENALLSNKIHQYTQHHHINKQ